MKWALGVLGALLAAALTFLVRLSGRQSTTMNRGQEDVQCRRERRAQEEQASAVQTEQRIEQAEQRAEDRRETGPTPEAVERLRDDLRQLRERG